MSNRSEETALDGFYEVVEGLGIDRLISGQERSLLQAGQPDTSTRIKYAAEDIAQNHGGPVVAGVLVTAALANSAPTAALADTGSVGRTGGTAAHVERTSRKTVFDKDQVILLSPNQTIFGEATLIAPERGVSIMTETHDIEQASHVSSEVQAEDLPIGFPLHVPAEVKDQIIPLAPNQTIFGEATLIAPERGVSIMTETHDIEQASHVSSEVQAEDLPIGFPLHVPAEVPAEVSAPAPKPHSHHERHASINPTPQEPKTLSLPATKPAVAPKKTAAPTLQPELEHATSHPRFSPTARSPQAHELPTKPFPMIPLEVTPVTSHPHPHHDHAAPVKPHVTPDLLEEFASPLLKHPFPKEPMIAKDKSRPDRHHHHADAHTHHAQSAAPAEAAQDNGTYGLHSSVLGESGLSLDQLRYALSQEDDGSMVSLAEAIHQAELTYHINGLYIAAAAGIESAWGTSDFATTRNNFFGYEAYTASPDDAASFPSPQASVDAFVNLLKQDYLHPGGQYYNGPTLHGIYVKYSTSHDVEAGNIAGIMNTLQSTARQTPDNPYQPAKAVETKPKSHPKTAQHNHHKHTGGGGWHVTWKDWDKIF
jgi:flagellum-specific peptidoglycan hydrolase FlgJ